MLIWLRWIAHAILLAALIPTAAVILQLVKSRQAPYYAMRADALKQAKRWMLIVLVLLILGIDLLVVPPRLAMIWPFSQESTPEDVPPSPIATSIIKPTLRPTRTPTTTPTRRPTATAPFIPTPTSAVPPPELALTPLPAAVPAGADAHITIVTLAAERDQAGSPVDPGDEFPPGDHRVYLFIAYDGMANGVAWTFVIYRERELLDSTTQLWEWGADGGTYLYYKPPGGYEAGRYEMQVFIEQRLQGIAQFIITE
ncbi:MAG: hypothetical protein GY832_01980 [Chloroflexi bacterium]|nr:hypothetical protein [Chloroflexota bacterium]